MATQKNSTSKIRRSFKQRRATARRAGYVLRRIPRGRGAKVALPAPKRDDKSVICNCIEYCAIESAVNAAFKVDPDPNNAHAECYDTLWSKRREQTLKDASANAHTPQGLLAKAAVMQTVIDYASYNGANLGIAETSFIASVAFDMRKWLRANFVENQ